MGFEVSPKVLERLYLTMLSASAFGFSMTSECNDFDLKNANDDKGDWKFYRFRGATPDCFMCYQRSDPRQRQLPELVLPCIYPNMSANEAQIYISYLVRRGGNSENIEEGMPFSVDEESGKANCEDDYNSANHLNESVIQLQQSQSTVQSGMIPMRDIAANTSYRLKIVSDYFPRRFLVCLTNVEFKEQPGSTLPLWVIFSIVLVVILGFFAIVGACFRVRKLREHQQTSDLDSKGIDAQSKQTQDNRKGGRDTNFQTTQGILKDRDDEYHVYNEIDIKEPSNIEMVYSLAYESFDSN